MSPLSRSSSTGRDWPPAGGGAKHRWRGLICPLFSGEALEVPMMLWEDFMDSLGGI